MPKLRNTPVLMSTIFGVALSTSAASAGLIDFEDAQSLGLSDNQQVTTQYQTSHGVTFSSPVLELVGDNDPDGFYNDGIPADDTETGSPTPGLGNYFLRTDKDFSDRGPGDSFLRIKYDEDVSAASGQIWDIDGNSSQGTEQWRVTFRNDGSEVESILSPKGTRLDPIGLEDNNGTLEGSQDGLPWVFSYGGEDFDEIDITFVDTEGAKDSGIGLAFDNFNTDSSSITDVPAPAPLGLLGFGLAILGGWLRIRQAA